MKNILNKIFGTVKILDGLISFYINTSICIKFLRNIPDDPYIVFGNVLVFLVIYLYCLYLIYSGWTDFMFKIFRKSIIKFGIVINIFLLIVMTIGLFNGDSYLSKIVVGISFFILTLLITLRDFYRIRNLRIDNN